MSNDGDSSNPVSNVSQDLKNKYDEYYDGSESEWRTLNAKFKAQNITDVCAKIAHDRIIDVGAGEGAVAQVLSDRGFGDEIVCTEISTSGVRAIEDRDIENVTDVVEFDGYRLPYADGEFDLAVATHVLEHVEHQRAFLQEIRRIAEYVYVEVPLLRTQRLGTNFEPNETGHINFYDYTTFRQLMQTTGYAVIDQRIFTHPRETLTFRDGETTGTIKYLIYKIGAEVNPRLFSKLLVYHCGILCREAGDRDDE